jgi:ribosomal protein S27AE
MANQRIPYYKLEVIAAALPKRYCPKCAGLVKAVDRLMAQQYLTQLAAGAADQSER